MKLQGSTQAWYRLGDKRKTVDARLGDGVSDRVKELAEHGVD